jgi:hypothetical protein
MVVGYGWLIMTVVVDGGHERGSGSGCGSDGCCW